MDFHKKYIIFKGFLIVIFLILPLASTENIDCKGKAFYCVNSTHFKICVDFGGGVSKTVDDFLIPCPTNTVCRNSNTFECEQQITTTPVPIRSSDVTIEQTELDVMFPEYKTNIKEELKTYYDSSTTTTEYSSSGAFSDTTEYTSSTLLDGRFNQVNLSSESNIQNSEKSDLSDSATVSFAPASGLGLLSKDNEYLTTTTAKVTSKEYLLNAALDTDTTNSTDDFSLATTVQIFEGVTERNVRLESINSSDVNISNNNEYNNSNILLTQATSVFTPSDIFVSYTETFNVTQDSTNSFKTVITPSTLNIENITNDSLIDLVNYNTTINSHTIVEEQTTKSDSVLNSTYNYELLSTGTVEPINNVDFNFTISSTFDVMDEVTMSTITPHTISEYTESMSLSNVFNTDITTNIILDTNTTETSVQGIFENKTEKLIIESSTPYDSIDHLITSTTSSDYRDQFFNNNKVTVTNTTTDLFENLTNNLAELSSISDKSFTYSSTESNPTTLYADSITDNLINLTIVTNQSLTNIFLESSTSSDNLSHLTASTTSSDYQLLSDNNNVTVTNTTDLYENITNNLSELSSISDKSFTYSSTESNPTTLYVDSIIDNLINLTIVTNQSLTNNFLESSTSSHHLSLNSLDFNNVSLDVKEEVTTNNIIQVNTYSDSTENYVPNVKNDTDFAGNKTISVISSATIPILLNASDTDVSDSYSSTTINYAPNSEYNQPATTVKPETFQNQELYSSSTRKSLSDFLNNKIVSTTMIYYDQDVVTLENENKTLENINTTEVTQSEQYLVALINITDKNFDNINIHTSPVTASTETMSIHLTTTQSFNKSNTLRASNMTENNNTVYSIKEQEIVLEKDFPKTQTNEVFSVSDNKPNKTINYSFTNGDSVTKTTLPLTKQELTTSKPYDTKTIVDISINNTISTTDDAISVIDSNLSLTGNVEFMDNVTTLNIHRDVPYTHHNNTSKAMQDFKLGNEGVVTESPTLTKSISSPKERTGVTFDNIYYTNTLDLLSNHQNITQTTSYATITGKNNTDMLDTQNNYVNASNGQVGAKNTLNSTSTNLINGTILKYNSALLSKQNLTGRNNETLIKNLETEPNRNMPPNNSVHIMNKGKQQEAQKRTNIPSTLTITEASFSTQAIPLALGRSNQTTVFTCLNRDRGKYSDKNNCNKFYICIGKPHPIVGMCPADTVFSEINKQCTKNLSHCIRNNQFKCLSSGRFIDVLSDEFYYVCVKNLGGYIRFKLQCQRGYRLNKENIKCSSESISIENFSKTTSDKSTDEKRSKEIKHKEKHETQFDCEKEGKFEYPDDCRKYFVCTKSKSKFRRKVKKCDSDEVFNKEKRKCVDSESYEC